MVKHIVGDIMSPPAPVNVIVHGCNCFHRMKSGVAKLITDRWPEVAKADIELTKYGDRSKLGQIIEVPVADNFSVINAYTQYEYGTDTPKIDYEAFEKAMSLVYEHFALPWNLIAMPKIGAGLAGGDWQILEKILWKIFKDFDVLVISKPMNLIVKSSVNVDNLKEFMPK